MKADRIKRLEKILERKLSVEEKERLRKIGRVLGIAADDATWDLLAAMEYQRTYYEDLPQKISAASTEILQNISVAAEAEARLAQGKLAERVAELAQKLAVRVNMATLLPMGLCALVCLLAYGSLAMWAGFHLGSGQGYGAFRILRMPSGVLMGGIALFGGLCLGVHTAREFAEGDRAWKKEAAIVAAMLTAGGALFGLGIM